MRLFKHEKINPASLKAAKKDKKRDGLMMQAKEEMKKAVAPDQSSKSTVQMGV